METLKKKKVLITVDYDPTAEKVAELGVAIAKLMGAEVYLIHVISDPMYYVLSGHVTVTGFLGEKTSFASKSKTTDGPQKVSQHFLDSLKQHAGDDSIQTLIKESDFALTILKAAKDINADFVIMGSHSKKWLENIVMGKCYTRSITSHYNSFNHYPNQKTKLRSVLKS